MCLSLHVINITFHEHYGNVSRRCDIYSPSLIPTVQSVMAVFPTVSPSPHEQDVYRHWLALARRRIELECQPLPWQIPALL